MKAYAVFDEEGAMLDGTVSLFGKELALMRWLNIQNDFHKDVVKDNKRFSIEDIINDGYTVRPIEITEIKEGE